MPVLGLGTLNNKGEGGSALVEAALAAGYRHIDAAEYYGNEDAVGRGLARSAVRREDVWVTTKVLHPKAPRPRSVRAAAEASLRRLGVEYVDALLIHGPNPHYELEESLAVFTRLREEGKVRYIGVSNFPMALLRRALDIAPELVLNQVDYHPYSSSPSSSRRRATPVSSSWRGGRACRRRQPRADMG
jgi:diketogulonate reductase-like aldo/keto reductase